MIFPKLTRKSISILFVAALTVALLSALASAYQRTDAVTASIATRMMTGIGNMVVQRTAAIMQSTEAQLQTDAILTRSVIQTALPDTQSYWLPLFWKQLELNPYISAIYIADTQGNFVKADRLPRAATAVIDARTVPAKEQLSYRQADFTVLSQMEKTTQFDPRTRPWYTNAQQGKAGQIYWSEIYHFLTLNQAGITASIPFFDTQGKLAGVLGADISLQGLNDFLSEQSFAEHDLTLIINNKTAEQQELIAYPVRLKLTPEAMAAQQAGKQPTLGMLAPEQAWVAEAYHWQTTQTSGTQAQRFSLDGTQYLLVALDFPGQNTGWKLLIAAEEDEVLGSANRSIAENITLSLFALLLFGFILYVVFGKPFRSGETV
jgi:hypothetical protein